MTVAGLKVSNLTMKDRTTAMKGKLSVTITTAAERTGDTPHLTSPTHTGTQPGDNPCLDSCTQVQHNMFKPLLFIIKCAQFDASYFGVLFFSISTKTSFLFGIHKVKPIQDVTSMQLPIKLKNFHWYH